MKNSLRIVVLSRVSDISEHLSSYHVDPVKVSLDYVQVGFQISASYLKSPYTDPSNPWRKRNPAHKAGLRIDIYLYLSPVTFNLSSN